MPTPERPVGQASEQIPVRELQVGQVFKPFEGVTAFPDIELDDTKRLNFLERPIQLFGARGKLSLLTDPTAEDLVATETPLGKVRFVRSFEGDNYEIDEVPLGIVLEFDITTMGEFQRLNRYVMEFNLGGKRYYLRCGGVDNPGPVERSITEEGRMQLFDSDFKPSEGAKEVTVLLPYDINKLAEIEAQVVERETLIR